MIRQFGKNGLIACRFIVTSTVKYVYYKNLANCNEWDWCPKKEELFQITKIPAAI